MKIPPLSYTSIRNFENCPRKFYHIHIAKDLPKEDSTAMRWGINVHSAFEKRIKNGTPLPETMAKWEKFCQFGRYIVKAEVKVAIRENGKPCDFFDSDVALRGKIDILVGSPEGLETAALLDIKTGKKREDPGELEIHAALLKASRPDLKVIIGHYIWLQTDEMGQRHDLSDTAATLREVARVKDEMAKGADVGYWPPRENPLCGWCPCTKCEFNPRYQK